MKFSSDKLFMSLPFVKNKVKIRLSSLSIERVEWCILKIDATLCLLGATQWIDISQI